MRVKYQVLHPVYYTDFNCIGGACEDTCCKGWTITIDKKTYLKYKKIKEAEFVDTLPQRIRRMRGERASDTSYAAIVLRENHMCPYLHDNGLCEIQAKHGADYLGTTCLIYPRQINQLGPKILEASLLTSCPEAVRKALFQKEPLTFQLSEMEFDHSRLRIDIKLSPDDTSDHATAHAWNVREACIDILQTRTLSLPDRMFVVGMMLKKVTELDTLDRADQISATAKLYSNAAAAGELQSFSQQFSSNPEAEAATFSTLFTLIQLLYQRHTKKYQPFQDLAAAFRKFSKKDSLDTHASTNEEVSLSTPLYSFVQSMTDKHWQDVQQRYGHVLENYLVNYVFSTVFPYKYYFQDISLYQHFVLLAEQYALLRMLLCHAEETGGLDEARLTKIFTSMSQLNQHIQGVSQIAELYTKLKLDNLAQLSYLLR